MAPRSTTLAYDQIIPILKEHDDKRSEIKELATRHLNIDKRPLSEAKAIAAQSS